MSDQEDEVEEREEEEKPAIEMAKVMSRLAQALEGMRRERVPTLSIFTGRDDPINVTVFFRTFRRYCTSMYPQDYQSWVQVLPTF